MLTLIFGIWMNLTTITHLVQHGHDCSAVFIGSDVGYGSMSIALFEDRTCDEVAAEINRKNTERE